MHLDCGMYYGLLRFAVHAKESFFAILEPEVQLNILFCYTNIAREPKQFFYLFHISRISYIQVTCVLNMTFLTQQTIKISDNTVTGTCRWVELPHPFLHTMAAPPWGMGTHLKFSWQLGIQSFCSECYTRVGFQVRWVELVEWEWWQH